MLTRRVFCALFALSGVLFAGCGSSSGVVPTDYFTTTLLGSQEVPANSAPGVGTAAVSTVDGKTRVVVDIRGLNGGIMGAHIHAGAPGVNGSIVLNLLTGTGTGTRDTSKPGELHIDFKYDAAVPGLSNKTHYINVHTDFVPSGELRGDLIKA